MPNKTKIEWATYSSNPIVAYTAEGKRGWVCSHASMGCERCYSERINIRLGTGIPFKKQEIRNIDIRLNEHELDELRKLSLKLAKKGEQEFCFICDMTDIFLPEIPEYIRDRVFDSMVNSPNLTFQILTKRAEEMRDYCIKWCVTNNVDLMPSNMFFGVSCENQEWYDKRVSFLIQTPARTRFISAEPLLGPIVDMDLVYNCPVCEGAGGGTNFTSSSMDDGAHECGRCDGAGVIPFDIIDQIIVGGESGENARTADPDWFRSIRDECEKSGTACFIKQMGTAVAIKNGYNDRKGGDMWEWPADLRIRQSPEHKPVSKPADALALGL